MTAHEPGVPCCRAKLEGVLYVEKQVSTRTRADVYEEDGRGGGGGGGGGPVIIIS